jgi:hypothetical protein
MPFNGDKSTFEEFQQNIILQWQKAGVSRIALGTTPRPSEINWNYIPEHYAQPDENGFNPHQLKINEAEAALRREVATWDEKNDKAIGILKGGIDSDLRKESGAMQSLECHVIWNHLNVTYGGAYDEIETAAILEKANEPIQSHETMNSYLSKFEDLHTKAGTPMNNTIALQARFVLIHAGVQRLKEPLNDMRKGHMGWVEAKAHLIQEDKIWKTTTAGKAVNF